MRPHSRHIMPSAQRERHREHAHSMAARLSARKDGTRPPAGSRGPLPATHVLHACCKQRRERGQSAARTCARCPTRPAVTPQLAQSLPVHMRGASQSRLVGGDACGGGARAPTCSEHASEAAQREVRRERVVSARMALRAAADLSDDSRSRAQRDAKRQRCGATTTVRHCRSMHPCLRMPHTCTERHTA